MPAKFGFAADSSEDSLERIVGAIERGSRDPFGGRYHVKPLIDVDILAGFADPDEMRHERELDRQYQHKFFRAEDVEVPEDFRDHIDDCQCEHEDGTCIKCCTQIDFDAFSDTGKQKINVRRGVLGEEVFDILFPGQPRELYSGK